MRLMCGRELRNRTAQAEEMGWLVQWTAHQSTLAMVAQFLTGVPPGEAVLYTKLDRTDQPCLPLFPGPIEGHPVGQHPTIVKLLQGIFNQRPTAPKYQYIRVEQVITFIKEAGNISRLGLKDLSKKLTVLPMGTGRLTSRPYIRDSDGTKEGVAFSIPGLTKTRRSGPPKEIVFHSFGEDPRLCPAATIRV